MDTYQPGEFILQGPIFLPFHTVHGALKARTLKWFAIPFPVDHILSQLSTVTHLSWVALHGMAHSFIELDKSVVPVISLISFDCKEQYCIGTWNVVRSTNQGKLEVVKQEMARVNINILGIGELKWTGMGEFNSDDHYIYYCGQESLRRNGVAIMVNKRV